MAGTPSGELFAAPAPHARSWTGVATSASLHVAAMAALTALAHVAPAPTAPREYRPITFVMMVPLPVPHEPTPPLTLTTAPPEPSASEPPSPLPAPSPEAPPPAPKPLARSEPGPAPPEPVRPAPPSIAPPPATTRTPPPVTIGLFADSAPTVHEAEAVRTVRAAGFDAPSPIAKSGETKSAAAAVGAFDQVAGALPAKFARAGAVVEPAGFGNSQVDRTASVQPVAQVRASGFDAIRPSAPAPARASPPPERVDVPVEIVFKPAPAYTAEARALKLEGDVVLDVEFTATGTVSVLQVMRGLGHGLDEAARNAAVQIRFKPAQSGGRPISFRTTVHIVFRLA